jgi:site-specific DNA-methyltransferase (adenine-specific)
VVTAEVIQGDCLEVMRGMEPASVDFVFTDPPYGHNNNNGDLISRCEAALGKGESPPDEWRPILNDGPEANDLFRAALAEIDRLLRAGGCCCCCCGGGGGPDPQFARWSLWMDEVLDFKQMVVWDKGPMGMGWHYRRSYETVLVGQKRGGKCRWYDTSRKVENIIRPGHLGIRKIIPDREQHPTEKPVNLARHFIRLHTLPGDTVLDPFMGGGTTAVACLKEGRNFIGIELEPKYVEMSRARIAKAREEIEAADRQAVLI